MNDLGALARKVLGKQFKSDIDDAGRRRQQSIRLDAVPVFVRAHFMPPTLLLRLPHLTKDIFHEPEG
jgi:hypothetical protein